MIICSPFVIFVTCAHQQVPNQPFLLFKLLRKKVDQRLKKTMLEEAFRLRLTTASGVRVTKWHHLIDFFRHANNTPEIGHVRHQIFIGVFESSPGWTEENAQEILDEMGWEYDEIPRRGNNIRSFGCIERLIGRRKCWFRSGFRNPLLPASLI
jgi:hypothetical protein